MKHYASPAFWRQYHALPVEARRQADRCYELLKANPRHPSLHFKRIGELWSVRAGLSLRALGVEVDGGIYWVWIGTHAEYDQALR